MKVLQSMTLLHYYPPQAVLLDFIWVGFMESPRFLLVRFPKLRFPVQMKVGCSGARCCKSAVMGFRL